MANEFIIKNGFHSKGNSEISGSTTITGSLTITGSAALAVTSSENISVAKYENGAHQSYCVPQYHYHSWYYNTTTRPIFEDDYINFGWAGTDLELTLKQLGTDNNVHITKNIGNAYSFLSVTDPDELFDLDGSMSAEESSFFYITNVHDDSFPMYKVIVTRAATDGTNKNMYMLVEKIKKTL